MLANLKIAQPTSVDELVTEVGSALASNTPIFAFGGRSKNNWGPWPPPTTSGTALSMAAINQVVSHEPGDMVVSVQAGARLADLQQRLAEHGQWLPLDPAHEDATVGGALATGTYGPRRQGYGTLKDHLLGMHVLGPRGQITKSGGRVVKNVAGFDLHRLHVGAYGTLGVIVEATFKVSTQPAHSSAYVLAFQHATEAHAWLLSVYASNLRPTALELLTGAEADRLAAKVPQVPAGKALVLVGIEGSDAFIDRHQRDIQARIPAETGSVFVPDARPLWRDYNQHLYGHSSCVVVRVGAKPTGLPSLLAPLAASTAFTVSAGLGIARLVFGPQTEAKVVGDLTRDLHQQALRHGGYAVVESAPLELPARATLPFLLPADSSSTTQKLSTTLKQTWDPNHLMHPGRAPG